MPGVAERLQLSEKQRDQLASLLDEARKRDPKAISPQLTDTERRRAMSVLSSSQQRRMTQISGKAFDFSRVHQVAVEAPALRDVTAWINSEPITLSALRGKVVALHFYTFGCINCIHNFPHYKDWHARFAGKPFVLLGLHTPETQGEHDVDAVRAAAQRAGLEFPIAIDGHASNWKAWGNSMWPSVYLIDKQGGVRYWWYGELNWEGAKGEEFMRGKIEELLAEKE
jgi:peroxiredoxin